MDADILVVGGGPVGLAAACNAASRGAKVIVVERHSAWPVDKACGEGLMPPAVRWLTKMGVHLPEAAPFAGIRYIDGATVAEVEFPEGLGLGVRRLVLSTALAERARSLGATLLGGVDVVGLEVTPDAVLARTTAGTLSARWLIGADGINSRVRAHLAIRCDRGPARFGMRRHFQVAEVPDKVEVHWHEDGEAYVTPVSLDRVGVALLRGDEKVDFDTLLARFPALAARLGEPVDAVRGAGPFARRVPTPWKGRVALLGDAAGYLDAITGEGLTLGWTGAEALVPLLLDGQPELWPARHRAIARRHLLFTRLLLTIARRPALRRRVIATLAASPAAFSTLLGFNSGHHGLLRAIPATLRLAAHLPLASGRAPE